MGKPAARVGDPTGHPGVIGPPGVPTVLIGGQPAATVGTLHTCSFPPPAVHPPSTIAPPGSTSVLIGGRPAARVGDTLHAQLDEKGMTQLIENAR